MKKTLFIFTLVVIFTACQNENQAGEVKSAWSSSDQWATWSNGGYTLYNDIWGSGAGSQSIWANSYSQWGVWANHPNTGGIKSYPNSDKVINKKLSTINTLVSSYNATTPSGGAWESTYDIWCNNKAYEIMLWMNYTGTSTGSGNVKPISYNWDASGNAVPYCSNQYIGGMNWNVYYGSNGSNLVFSFLRIYKNDSGTADIKAILNWIKSKNLFGDVTVGEVQYGFEITSCWGTNGGGSNFTCNSYSVTSN